MTWDPKQINADVADERLAMLDAITRAALGVMTEALEQSGEQLDQIAIVYTVVRPGGSTDNGEDAQMVQVWLDSEGNVGWDSVDSAIKSAAFSLEAARKMMARVGVDLAVQSATHQLRTLQRNGRRGPRDHRGHGKRRR